MRNPFPRSYLLPSGRTIKSQAHARYARDTALSLAAGAIGAAILLACAVYLLAAIPSTSVVLTYDAFVRTL